MSSDNKALARRAYDAMGKGDFDALAALMADDMVEHEALPGVEPNKDGVLQFFKMLRAAFPDLTMTAHDMVAEGDRVFVRLTMSGTHRGEFMGMPATGRKIAVPMADFLRVQDGKLAEHWGVTDVAAMMEQLGAQQG
jgi:steroid delta-isomerase-like uncharacterized protein